MFQVKGLKYKESGCFLNPALWVISEESSTQMSGTPDAVTSVYKEPCVHMDELSSPRQMPWWESYSESQWVLILHQRVVWQSGGEEDAAWRHGMSHVQMAE